MGESKEKDPLIGRQIAGKFKILHCIGIGGSGSVYAAEQMTLGRTVAVKVLNPDLASTPRIVKRFHDEALAASRLNHPNTVSVIDYGQTDDGLLYLVMEFVAGKTLTQMIDEEYPLPIPRILGMINQVLLGLEEAHDAGIVHADLKCDNIIVDRRRGGWDLVKVVDFGIARIIGENDEPGVKKTICGTPEYMAPELVRGRPATASSDLYAVGIILFELITAKTPFVGGSSIEVLRRQVHNQIPRPSEITSDVDVPKRLDEIIVQALSKNPQHRFTDAVQMRSLLERCKQELSSPSQKKILCRGCGTFVEEQFRFCPECGTPRGKNTVDSIAVKRVKPKKPVLSTHTIDVGIPEIEDATGVWPLPFVGRVDELMKVNETIATPGSKLLINGARGMGRSRLLSAAYGASAGKKKIYQTGPDPGRIGRTTYPMRAVIASFLELPEVSDESQLDEALETIGLPRRFRRGIRDCFGLIGADGFVDSDSRNRELCQSVANLLARFANQQEAVFVFEDAHLYDQLSIACLRQILEQGISVIITSDSGFELDLGTLDTLELEPLSLAPIQKLYEHLKSKGIDYVSEPEELLSISHGNPKNLHHLIRYGMEGGNLEFAPEKLPDLISARVGMLPQHALMVCQLAAVIGQEQLTDDLLAAAEKLETDQPVEVALDLLAARDYTYEYGEILGFSDPLVRDVVLDSTPADIRRSLHSLVAMQLRKAGAEVDMIGYHDALAENYKRASKELSIAAETAIVRGNLVTAIEYDKKALASARSLMLGGDMSDEAELQFLRTTIRLAESMRKTGETKLAMGLVIEAENYAAEFPLLRACLLFCQANISATDEKLERGIAQLERAALLASQFGAQVGLIDVYQALAHFLFQLGRTEDAEQQLAEGLSMIELLPLVSPEDQHHKWRVLVLQAELQVLRGNTEKGLEILRQAIEKHAHESIHTAGQIYSRLLSWSSEDDLPAVEKQIAEEMHGQGDERSADVIVSEIRDLGPDLDMSLATLNEAITLEKAKRAPSAAS